jgi:hypothetical protein
VARRQAEYSCHVAARDFAPVENGFEKVTGLRRKFVEARLLFRPPKIAEAAASLTRVLLEDWETTNKEQRAGRRLPYTT